MLNESLIVFIPLNNETRKFKYRDPIVDIELENFILSFPLVFHLNNRFSFSLEYMHGIYPIPNHASMFGKQYYRMANFGVVFNFGANKSKTAS